MIPHRNCEVFASVIFFLVIKIFCSLIVWYRGMYKKQPTLTSIPERNETEDERATNKWVPKKKHEVLKAKYKCLKKLFQIYDASVIGILPENYSPDGYIEDDVKTTSKRKKRSHRTKTDACAGTTEKSSGDVSVHSDTDNINSDEDKDSIATAVIRDLKIKAVLSTSTQMESQQVSKEYKYAATQDSRDNLMLERNMSADGDRQECEFTQTNDPRPMPYLLVNEKRPRMKPTRFQCFLQRIFGIRQERSYKNYVLPNGHIYAASDNSFSDSYCEKHRRRGLRFRRLRRPKKIQSDTALRDLNSPVIFSYVQSVQRSCLADTTSRHCPILGCLKISYGIINYNDHLNLSHFPERKFVCHYCHEGFERQYDKFLHENEHIGISKFEGNNISAPSTTGRTACNTQTEPEILKCDVPEDKLKKIVSFFDKINDPEQIFSDIKKNRYSDCNLQRSNTETETVAESTDSSDKRTVSCVNLPRKSEKKGGCSSADSETTGLNRYGSPVTCHICGENFNYRRQLSLHVDLEHRVYDKYSKFHSCDAILNHRPQNRVDMVTEDGKINVQSIDRSRSGIMRRDSTSSFLETYSDLSRRRSEESLSCDPSTNIVYYTSMETVKKPSKVTNMVQKVRNGLGYKWEPGTKIIRV